jgi:hypothetical protein
MKRIWFSAICLVMVIASILWKAAEYSRTDWTYRQTIPAADIAFIGTSLIRDAVPEKGPPVGILADGRDHVRVWGLALDEATETRLLNAVIDAGIGTIFLEAYPYIREFASSPQKAIETSLVERYEAKLVWGARRLRSGARTIMNRLLSRTEEDEAIRQARTFDGDLSSSKRDYPLRLISPSDAAALRAAIQRAQARGLQVIVVGLPRSQNLVDYLGTDEMQRLNSHVEAFAATLAVLLWSPANAWPNDRFVDQSHLNSSGRQHFVSALRDRFGAR